MRALVELRKHASGKASDADADRRGAYRDGVNWDELFDGMTAVGTVAASFAAVWFGAVQPRRRRPVLDVGNPQTIWAQTNVTENQVAEMPWLLVPISNERSRDAADARK